jgi:hypothetical protein
MLRPTSSRAVTNPISFALLPVQLLKTKSFRDYFVGICSFARERATHTGPMQEPSQRLRSQRRQLKDVAKGRRSLDRTRDTLPGCR